MNPLPSHPLPLQFVIGSISVSNHHQYLWLPHVYLILSLKIQFVSTPPRFFPLGVFMCTCNCLPFFFFSFPSSHHTSFTQPLTHSINYYILLLAHLASFVFHFSRCIPHQHHLLSSCANKKVIPKLKFNFGGWQKKKAENVTTPHFNKIVKCVCVWRERKRENKQKQTKSN